MSRSTKCPRSTPYEAVFRILQGVPESGLPTGDLCEQTIEVALGSDRSFKDGNIGILKRRIPADRVVNAIPPPRYPPKPRKRSRPPYTKELLQQALEWESQLKAGAIASQAEIARRESITRARVTQIMALATLSLEIQEYILAMSPRTLQNRKITERSLRPITRIKDWTEQMEAFKAMAKLKR